MSDYTKCAGCRHLTNGEEYCPECECAMEAKQDADERRGFSLPVKVSELANGGHIVIDDDGTWLAKAFLRDKQGEELAQLIALTINEAYQNEEGA